MKLQKIKYRNKHYYVDYRLRQFRSIPKDNGTIEFYNWKTDDFGDVLLAYMLNNNLVPEPNMSNLF